MKRNLSRGVVAIEAVEEDRAFEEVEAIET